MQQFLNITSALADENRVRALLSLRLGELCLCQVTELLGLAPSTVSKHLSLLKQAGLVAARKQGRWMYYRIADDDASVEVQLALEWAFSTLVRDPCVREDVRRLKRIRSEDPEEICKRQCKKRECCSSAPETPAAARSRKVSRALSRAM